LDSQLGDPVGGQNQGHPLSALGEELQAPGPDDRQVCSADHHADLVPLLRQPHRQQTSDGAGADDADLHGPEPSPSLAASPMRCGFPVAPFGISVRSTTFRGTLKCGSFRAQKSRSSRSVAVAPSRSTTAAATSSPSLACGMAKVIAWATAGWVESTSST